VTRVRLTLEYDGTDYVGWQVQPNGLSVQAVVERALGKLLGAPTPVQCAGRTDAGVHALGQVVAFNAAQPLPLKAYLRGLSGLLPPDVAVVAVEEVAAEFDPRRDARGKRYRYRVCNRAVRSPLRRRTHWEVFAPLNVLAMREAAPYLLGRHDFSAFRASDCGAAHAVRTLWRLDVEAAGDELAFVVEGTAFLKHMVRNLVGTLVEVGKGRQPPGWVAEVLASRDRTRAGPTAPAHGLVMEEVFYVPPRGAPAAPVDDDEGSTTLSSVL
jgi:tRNA pseudouridine38-40 synthase